MSDKFYNKILIKFEELWYKKIILIFKLKKIK